MKINDLQEEVYEANIELQRRGLVLFTWGNASGIDRERGVVVIKPSGVPYETMRPCDMVALDLATGVVVEGTLRPSSDAPTHLVLYRAFPSVGGVVHTHSTHAVAWAQARRDIPVVGTTCADYFYRDIPCARSLTDAEINGDYETETGNVIVETFRERELNAAKVPGVLAANHGPFAWGTSPSEAARNAVVLEETAKSTLLTAILNPELPTNRTLIEKHFQRKHGPNAYYGQR